MNFDTTILESVDVYSGNSVPKMNISGISDWNEVKERISVKLINYEANQRLLMTIPHKRFLDLAEVYYYIADVCGRESMATILIQNQYMEMWGISRERLAETAYANCRRYLPVEIKSMKEILEELEGGSISQVVESSMPEMYIATNRQRKYGAVVMLFSEVLGEFAERAEDDLYILPSSVHEIILLPVGTLDKEILAETVRGVNRTQVSTEENLSDTVYRYCRESGRIEMA